MKVGVVGAGYAGALAGVLLARAGHDVELFERVEQPAAVGAGIMLQPTGLAVLQEAGLVDRVLARSARLDGLISRTASGTAVLDLTYSALGKDVYGVGMHRGVLFTVLHDELSRCGAKLTTGVDVVRIDDRESRPVLADAGGATYGPYDLVLCADGAKSKLRDPRITKRVTEYPWGALWFVAPDDGHQFPARLEQVCSSTKVMLGCLPTGLGTDGDTPQVSLFWSIATSKYAEWRARPFDEWRRELIALDLRVEQILAHAHSHDDLALAVYYDVILNPLHAGRVVYLGDAAHAMSPQLGQGANLALVDASTLARAVVEERDLDRALTRYSRERRAHLDYYGWASRFLTPFFQSDRTWLTWIRDATFGLASRLWPTRGIMLKTLAGVKRGWIRPSYLLSPGSRPE